jgi:glycosyltransferase involved in cell wall biosynthesis
VASTSFSPAIDRLSELELGQTVQTRIAVIHCGFTYSGGGERLVLEQVAALRRRGFTVDLFAPTVDPKACFPALMERVRPRSLFPQLPRWLPFREAIQLMCASVFAPLLALTLPRYDIIVGENQPGVWIAWVVSALRRKPYLAYLNQPCRLIYPRSVDVEAGWKTKLDYHLLDGLIQRIRGFVKWADRASVRNAHTVLVDGMFIGRRIAAVYDREVLDCPGAAHPAPTGYARGDTETGEIAVNGTRIAKPYVLLTNRHYPQKRFDLVIAAMSRVAEAGTRSPLVITGGHTSYTRSLVKLAKGLGISDRVHFVGEVSEADLQRLYAEAAVYVYPAPEEDFGLGIVEAMTKEVPVVAWGHGGPTVTIEDGVSGHLATPYSVEDFAERIRSLLADPQAARAMGRAGRRRAEAEFSWATHAARLHVAVRTALDGSSSLQTRARARALTRVTSIAAIADAAMAKSKA